MFTSFSETLSQHQHRYVVERDGAPLGFGDALELWQRDEAFRSFFTNTLCESPSTAFRWETPALTTATLDRPFEFVLLDSPSLARKPDRQTFADYFTRDACETGVVTFDSLGKDSQLIVPTPQAEDAAYVHLAVFLREGPSEQIHTLWETVGREVQKRVSDVPLWLSTAGGGVAWLHVRIDTRPKYYGHAPYRSHPTTRE